jgi:hypothetical protein
MDIRCSSDLDLLLISNTPVRDADMTSANAMPTLQITNGWRPAHWLNICNNGFEGGLKKAFTNGCA